MMVLYIVLTTLGEDETKLSLSQKQKIKNNRVYISMIETTI